MSWVALSAVVAWMCCIASCYAVWKSRKLLNKMDLEHSALGKQYLEVLKKVDELRAERTRLRDSLDDIATVLDWRSGDFDKNDD